MEKFLHMRNVTKMFHIMYNLCRNVAYNDISLLQTMLFCCKICFVAIYVVLSRNLFCRKLRAFVWRKIEPEIVLVEKKRQISGMAGRCCCIQKLQVLVPVN